VLPKRAGGINLLILIARRLDLLSHGSLNKWELKVSESFVVVHAGRSDNVCQMVMSYYRV
jgi:hypothetical protein